MFVKTKHGADKIVKRLKYDGHKADAIHGNLRQSKRDRVINGFRNGHSRILIATDVAARGLDIPVIKHVINYDLPQVPEDFIHRIGRTGRAGRNGEAILFVNPRERSFLSNLERAVGQPIEKMDIPDNDLINNNRIKKLQAKLIKAASTERDNPEESNILEELIIVN